MSKIKVKQIASTIRRNKLQKLHLNSLGLRKIGSERIVEDNASIRGLLKRVAHLVVWEQIK